MRLSNFSTLKNSLIPVKVLQILCVFFTAIALTLSVMQSEKMLLFNKVLFLQLFVGFCMLFAVQACSLINSQALSNDAANIALHRFFLTVGHTRAFFLTSLVSNYKASTALETSDLVFKAVLKTVKTLKVEIDLRQIDKFLAELKKNVHLIDFRKIYKYALETVHLKDIFENVSYFKKNIVERCFLVNLAIFNFLLEFFRIAKGFTDFFKITQKVLVFQRYVEIAGMEASIKAANSVLSSQNRPLEMFVELFEKAVFLAKYFCAYKPEYEQSFYECITKRDAPTPILPTDKAVQIVKSQLQLSPKFHDVCDAVRLVHVLYELYKADFDRLQAIFRFKKLLII